MGRSTGIIPIAIQAIAPATKAVREVDTTAQRPSVVAKAALAVFRLRRSDSKEDVTRVTR